MSNINSDIWFWWKCFSNFLVHLFWVGLAWCTIGIYCSAIYTFLEAHHLHKASDHLGHLPSRICIESHSNVNLCPIFYLKGYLICTESFRTKPDGSHVTSLVLGNNRQHWPVFAKTISSWVRKVLCVAKAHISVGSLLGGCYFCSLSNWCFSGDHPAGRWLDQSFYTS